MSTRIGIDTGGTFTDLVALDEASGRLTVAKVPSRPNEPHRAVLEALDRSDQSRTAKHITLGTTVGINAVLERRGASVVYLTTSGFEDIPFIQRVDKKDPYDLQWQKPVPFVERTHCFGVTERVDSDGEVITRLTKRETESVIRRVRDVLREERDGDVSVAVNLLFSYLSPKHEQLLKEALAEIDEHLHVSVSSSVSPIWREYERASTTILDAYLKPLLSRFLDQLANALEDSGYSATHTVMKSNGGQMLYDAAKERPIQTMLSGLAGGIVAGKYFGAIAGRRNLVTFDMGGTSTDVSAIVDGRIPYTTEYQVDFNLPVSAPFVDMKTIGAGGGSVAWIDAGGMLKVGPRSAGAEPGPVCYRRGGIEPTVTDANLALGRLNPDNFLGGEMKLDVDGARKSIDELGAQLGYTIEEAAQAIVEIASENMANAIRVLTIERGLDPRDFALVAFGGAGPLHAGELRRILGLERVLVPPFPGLASAFGTLVSDLRVDHRWTHYMRSDQMDPADVATHFQRLEAQAVAELREEGFRGTPEVARSISMRYAGQNYERDITVSSASITEEVVTQAVATFHSEHRAFYGYAFEDEVVEFIHFNVTAFGRRTQPELPELPAIQPAEPYTVRPIHFAGSGYLECLVYRRSELAPSQEIAGPAIIEEMDSTTLVSPGEVLSVESHGLLMISAEAGPDTGMQHRTASAEDSVTLSILHNYLLNSTREMGVAMMRTAYSPIFSESRDFSCALFNRDGELIAQGEFCPAQLGAVPLTVKWMVGELGLEALREGDVFVHNDPYRGGCHMPEHTMLKPVFFDGELTAFAVVIGHVAEIGAKAIGSFASDATEVFQEGLRLPPVKLMSRGEHVKDVWNVIMANHRTPRNTWGDFHAMLGALTVAENRLHALYARYGPKFVRTATDRLIDYSERLMKEELRRIPDGEYAFEEVMEDDGISDRPYAIRANVVVDGERLIVDFTRSDEQAKGPINATYAVTVSATYNALLQLTGGHIPRNAGCYRPIITIAPPGSIVNVQFPGPSVGGNTETQPRIVGAILGALSAVLPEKVMAAEGATSCNFLFGGKHPRDQRFYAHYHFEASGWGGRHTTDGNSVQNHIHGNCRNTPVEIFETIFPFLTECYELIPDSGGAGRRRGGLASRRILQVRAPEIVVSTMMDHVREGAYGIFGGRSGGLAGIWIRRSGEREFRTFKDQFGTVSPSKFADVRVEEGDEIMICSAGGGGYGDPLEREEELVREDLRNGFISKRAAREAYGRSLTDTD